MDLYRLLREQMEDVDICVYILKMPLRRAEDIPAPREWVVRFLLPLVTEAGVKSGVARFAKAKLDATEIIERAFVGVRK